MNHPGHPSSAASATADPWLGRVVGGRWRILSLLDDSGGMASVYLAEDTRLERRAVVKIPRAAHLHGEFVERFAREAKWHARVENVHVVHILDRGEEAGAPFLVLRYLPGGNLKAWCARNPSMLVDPRLHFEAWLLPIAEALDAVAAEGLVHRDVKPTNILFDAEGKGYLSDFGIVKAGSEATLTGTGLFIGTLQFMSPEQCQPESKRSLDGRSDQYGLAVTVYQVLTDWKYPVENDTAVVYAAKFGHQRMIEPREHEARVPRAVNEVVMRALSPDRDARFATNVEFARAVMAAFTEAGDPAGPQADPPSTRRRALDPTSPGPRRRASPLARARRHKGLLAAAGALVASGAVAASVALWTKSADEETPPGLARVVAVDPAAVLPRRPDSPPSLSPRVTALKLAPLRPLKAGDELEWIVTFSQPVTVTGRPRILFRAASDLTIHSAEFARGNGSDRIVFLFEVPHGRRAGGGLEILGISVNSPPVIDLHGGEIADAATGTPADVTIEPPANLSTTRIDGVPPRVTTVVPPSGATARTTGDRLEFRVQFDEPVEVDGQPALLFTANGDPRRAEWAGVVDSRTLTFAYRIAEGDVSSDGVTATSVSLTRGTIRDAAGNAADTRFAPTTSAAFAINARPQEPAPPAPVERGRLLHQGGDVEVDPQRCAAIAYSKNTGRYGYAWNQPSREAAEARALRECNTADAKVVAWVQYGWAVLVIADDNAHGFDTVHGPRADSNDALTQALAHMRAFSTARVKTIVLVCSGDWQPVVIEP